MQNSDVFPRCNAATTYILLTAHCDKTLYRARLQSWLGGLVRVSEWNGGGFAGGMQWWWW